MAKANGLDADNNSVNTLMSCIFALAKHGMDPVDKWSTKTVKSLFEFKCQTETVTDKSKSVQVEHGFTGREVEALDILQNIPNLLSFVFPGKPMTGLYLSPKTCSYPIDDWQVGHISLFDALDDALHCHCIICFGQNNYFVAFKSQESKQTNTRKSLSSAKPKVWLFDGDVQHEAHLTSHQNEKEMRTYITELLKKHNQSSQQNVQIRMCGHYVSLRYQMKKGVVQGLPMPSFPVPRFKTQPLLVIVMETLVNKKCTMVDVRSTQFHSIISAEEKLEATQKLKALQKGNKNPYQMYSPRISQLATLPAPIRSLSTTTKYPSVLTVSQGKVSLSIDRSKSAQSQILESKADKKVHNQSLWKDTASKKKSNQITASTTEAAKKVQDQTASQKDGNKKGHSRTGVDDTATKKAQNHTASNTMRGHKGKDATAEVSHLQRGVGRGVSADKGASKKAVYSKANAATVTGIGSKSRATGIKDYSIMPVVLVENIAKAASPENKKDIMSLIITDVKSPAKTAKASHSGAEKRKRSPSPESQPEASTRLTRSMRRSLPPQENNEVKTMKSSATRKQRRSLNVVKSQSEKGKKSHADPENNNKSKIEKNSPKSTCTSSSNGALKSNVKEDANTKAQHLKNKNEIEKNDPESVKSKVDEEGQSKTPVDTHSKAPHLENKSKIERNDPKSVESNGGRGDCSKTPIASASASSKDRSLSNLTRREQTGSTASKRSTTVEDIVNGAIASEYSSDEICTETMAATPENEDRPVSPAVDVEMHDDTCNEGEDKSTAEEDNDNATALTDGNGHAQADDVEMSDNDGGDSENQPQPQEQQQQTEVNSSNTTTTATATAVAAGDFSTASSGEEETETCDKSSSDEKQNEANTDEDKIERNGAESPTLSVTEETDMGKESDKSTRLESEESEGITSTDEISPESQATLDKWLQENKQNLYPGQQEKAKLAEEANRSVTQLSKWLRHVRCQQVEVQFPKENGNKKTSQKGPLKLNLKKLQAVCKDVQANKRTKKNPPVCTAQSPSINQVKTTTTTSADSPPILPRAKATVTQSMSYPVQLMVPMNTLLIPAQQGTGGVGVVHVPQVVQPQAVPVTVPQVVPVSLPPLIQSLQSLLPSSNDAVMPTLIPQNGMSEEMENPMAVNNEFGPEMPIEPIVIMPEDTEGDTLSSQGTPPVLSPQIELGSSMRTATPHPEASTNRGSREVTQLFSTETDLYGSPGVAFTVKKTGATYGTPSPPQKCGDVLGRRSSVRSATSMSETSDNEDEGSSLLSGKPLAPNSLMAKDSAPLFGDLSQHSGTESDTARSARTLRTRSTSIDTGSVGEHTSDAEADKRSSKRRTLRKRKRTEESVVGGQNDGDDNSNANPASAAEPDAAKKRRLDGYSEGNRPEMNSSENDKNNEADQIPEAAARVITKWFRDHQGTNFRCPELKERLMLAGETNLPLTHITKWFESVRKEMLRQLGLGDYSTVMNTSELEDGLHSTKQPVPRLPSKDVDNTSSQESATTTSKPKESCTICFRGDILQSHYGVNCCASCKEYIDDNKDSPPSQCKDLSKTGPLCKYVFADLKEGRCKQCFFSKCREVGVLFPDTGGSTQERNLPTTAIPAAVPASGYAPSTTDQEVETYPPPSISSSSTTSTEPTDTPTPPPQEATPTVENAMDNMEVSTASETVNNSELITIESDDEQPVPLTGSQSMAAEVVYDQSSQSMPINIQPISIEPKEDDTGSESGSMIGGDDSNEATTEKRPTRTRFTEKQLKTLEAEFAVNPQSTKIPLIARALQVPQDSVKNWFKNRRNKAKWDEAQQQKRLEMFTCRVCGQECFSEKRYVSHYRMAHKTRVVITRYQDQETGETRTKAEYEIVNSDKKEMSTGKASDRAVREEGEKNSPEEVSNDVTNDSFVEMERKLAETKKDTVVVVVRKGSFSKKLEEYVAACEKRTQEQNKAKQNQSEKRAQQQNEAEQNQEQTEIVKDTEKEEDDSDKSKNTSESGTKTTEITTKENPPGSQRHINTQDSDENRQSNQNERKEQDQGQRNATGELNSEIQKRTNDTVQRPTTTQETQKRADVNDGSEVRVKQNVSGKDKVVKDMSASKKDRLAKLYEQISLKRKLKQQQQK